MTSKLRFREVEEHPEDSGQLRAVFETIMPDRDKQDEWRSYYLGVQRNMISAKVHKQKNSFLEFKKAVEALEQKKAENPEYYKLNNWESEWEDSKAMEWGESSIKEHELEGQFEMKEA